MEVILANRRLLTLLLVINGCYVSSHVTATGSQATDQHVSTHQAFVPTSVVQPTSMTVSIDQPTSMTVLALEGSTTSSMTYSDITTHPIMPSASSDTVKQGVSLPPTVMPSATSAGTLGESSLGTIGMLTTSSDIKRESKGSMETPLLTTGSIAILTTTATVSMEMSDMSSGFSNLVVTPSSSNTDTTGQSTDSSFLSGMISTTYPQKTTNPSSAESLLPSTMLDNASTAMSILPSPSTSLPMPSSSLPVDETKPNADHSKGGLTNGGKAALGICIPIIIILVIVGIIYLFYRKRHYSASWKLSDVVSYRPWSYNNATYYDDESTLIIPSLK
ncbi:uncharacterized protein LOC126812227 isoform X5 [Patella vulgata]|uniref:uncharacterized protein LOC126812227 isoform X5 n=1 Tax=Patella vulgata TaxID=6465 RepID=UPI00217FC92D|nr:uncharacterized protein LOC126812227 isoform X5 [Patella vulgata]